MMAVMHDWLQALEDQASSTALRESVWMYPLVETVHVLTIAMFAGFAVLLDLRLMGVLLTGKPVSRVAAAFLPRTRRAFVVMLASGALLFYAKPLETACNPFFQIKLAVMGIAALNVFYFHRIASADAPAWDHRPVPPNGVRASGLLSILCWAAVVVCGRMIAYNWFD